MSQLATATALAYASFRAESIPVEIPEQTQLFKRAFELAYFIHPEKEIAFFIAEDAVDALASMLGRQKKNRVPSERLRGFWKWGERTRPVRRTLNLDKELMLQWLVFNESQAWERQTEESGGPYPISEDDLVIRYIEYLVFIAMRRGSFYVTMAICSLLYKFGRRETRLFYDVLVQSDPARIKDSHYIGKQRAEMLKKVVSRFGEAAETVEKSTEGRELLMRPASERMMGLIIESLRRFTPWGTACVIQPSFEITDIPSLYFSEASPVSEEVIERDRIHTVIDPECFRRFTKRLAEYVKTLPASDLDADCDFSSLDQRIEVPRILGIEATLPRGDRFHPPELTPIDYLRFQRNFHSR